MADTAPPWMQRLAALALLLALPALGYLGVAAPLMDGYAEARAEIVAKRERLTRLYRVAALRDGLQARLSALRRTQADSGVFLDGSTPALAAARLQDRVSRLAGQTGGEVRSVQSLKPEPGDGVTRIAVKARVTGDVRALQELLYALETGRPLIFVEDLEVRARLRRGETGLALDPELTVNLTLAGFRLEDGTS